MNQSGVDVALHDPNVTKEHINNWDIKFLDLIDGITKYDSIVLAVNHSNYSDVNKIIENSAVDGAYIFDVKNQLSKTDILNKGFQYDSL